MTKTPSSLRTPPCDILYSTQDVVEVETDVPLDVANYTKMNRENNRWREASEKSPSAAPNAAALPTCFFAQTGVSTAFRSVAEKRSPLFDTLRQKVRLQTNFSIFSSASPSTPATLPTSSKISSLMVNKYTNPNNFHTAPPGRSSSFSNQSSRKSNRELGRTPSASQMSKITSRETAQSAVSMRLMCVRLMFTSSASCICDIPRCFR